jgi:F-type H+-transporting ATPase subunit delta
MLDPVTSRYAEALFGLAKKDGTLDSVTADVGRLTRELSSPAVRGFFFDARVSVEERRQKLRVVTSSMHQLTRNFIDLLFDKRREEVLLGLGEAFHRQALDERNAAEGVVESARPIDATEIARLATALGAQLGKTVTLENRVTPDVLGGVRVIVGSQMVDHSLRGRLGGLAKQLQNAALPSMAE